MTGWNIGVFRQKNGGASPATVEPRRHIPLARWPHPGELEATQSEHGARLGVWQTGPDGLDWLEELVKEGHAIGLGGDGYPLRYTATAKFIIPRIIEKPPEARSHWIYQKVTSSLRDGKGRQ